MATSWLGEPAMTLPTNVNGLSARGALLALKEVATIMLAISTLVPIVYGTRAMPV